MAQARSSPPETQVVTGDVLAKALSKAVSTPSESAAQIAGFAADMETMLHRCRTFLSSSVAPRTPTRSGTAVPRDGPSTPRTPGRDRNMDTDSPLNLSMENALLYPPGIVPLNVPVGGVAGGDTAPIGVPETTDPETTDDQVDHLSDELANNL